MVALDTNGRARDLAFWRKAVYYKGYLIRDGLRYFMRFNFIEACKIYFALLFGSGTITVSIRELAYPLALRSGTSDISVFRQLFLDRCYDFQIDRPLNSIIDCGANIGLFSVLFASRYPEARIVAVEPDTSNFELLKRNTSRYPNIECVHSGVWSRTCHLRIKNQHVGAWAYEVEEIEQPEPSSFPSVTVHDLLQHFKTQKIDMLKMDIEGAEKEVFGDNYESWIHAFKCLIVEVHDKLRAGSSEAVTKAVGDDEIEHFIRGRNYFFERVESNDDAFATRPSVD